MELNFHTFDAPVKSLKITGSEEDLLPLSSLLSIRKIKIFDISFGGPGIQYFRGEE